MSKLRRLLFGCPICCRHRGHLPYCQLRLT
jgi:hypothetical protein